MTKRAFYVRCQEIFESELWTIYSPKNPRRTKEERISFFISKCSLYNFILHEASILLDCRCYLLLYYCSVNWKKWPCLQYLRMHLSKCHTEEQTVKDILVNDVILVLGIKNQMKFITRLPWWVRGKESACQCRGHRFDPWFRKIPHACAPKPRRHS